MRHRKILAALALSSFLLLTACSPGAQNSVTSDTADNKNTPIVIGSQDYYSSEIIAEIYAQSLESKGYSVDRQFRIGQREIYVPEIEAGSIDLFPEYSGPLLQYWVPDTTARLADDVYAQLAQSTPDGLRVLDQSGATDQNSYTVTRLFAEKWGLETLDDLAKVTDPLMLGGNSEGATRPDGPVGMKNLYGVDLDFTPIEDGGGPLTVKALKDGAINLAIIYSADPSIGRNDLVPLKDTEGLFLASHVVPLASDNLDANATEAINQISQTMSDKELVALNSRSLDEELPAETIARDWLSDKNLL
ncbi:ABC transporter substrate-binding protein [Paeniglutamicibacter terrestris]|uniref:ABC transporter substrate-binding protein n=1 Tax=Paeniglutamicibacter terrestris TaxID=2723403 RepID=A0ABX1G0T1_9MICC|nr:ABC transporter substrate-binding protein [Paeniglutamicibacter terrestris]NKG19825.1 ABC transporter substrate-binding protein [Paeniglutamicibacter terrestris]